VKNIVSYTSCTTEITQGAKKGKKTSRTFSLH